MCVADETSARADVPQGDIDHSTLDCEGFAALFHDRFVPLIAIKGQHAGQVIEARDFRLNQRDDLLRWGEKKNREGFSIYFSICPLVAPLGKKAKKEDIREVRWLWVDCDPPKDCAGAAFDIWRASMLASLSGGKGKVPRPTLIVDSGRGYWAFWRLAEPLCVDGAAGEQTRSIERALRAMSAIFDADRNACNIDRIARFPGFQNLKTGRTAGVVESHVEREYPFDIFPRQEPKPTVSIGAGTGACAEIVNSAEARHSVRLYLESYAEPAIEGQNGRAATMKVLQQCMDRGVTQEVAIEMMEALWNHRCSPPWAPDEIGNTFKGLRRDDPIGAKLTAIKSKVDGSRKLASPKRSVVECAANIVMRPKEWLWEGHLLRGAQELLTGIPGLGKSQVQIQFIACATAALPWPDGALSEPAGNVIMLTAEDVLDQEVVPRLTAAGADLKRVHILKSIKTDEKTSRQFLLAEDLVELERVVQEIGDVALITIDPITAYMGGKIDSHKTTDVRSQLGPLKDFAERTNVAVSTITHPPKSAGQKAIDHFIGSQAFIAAGRIGHLCVAEMEEAEDGEPEPTGRVLFTNAKNNAHRLMPTLAYQIREHELGANIVAPRVTWDSEAVGVSADQAVQAAAGIRHGAARGEQAKVQHFLSEMLESGPQPAQRIEAEACRRGYSRSQTKTAKQKLGIESTKDGRGGWVWSFPSSTII
jgi:putative DNA primase/helicase